MPPYGVLPQFYCNSLVLTPFRTLNRSNLEWYYFIAFASKPSFYSEKEDAPCYFLKTSFIIFVNFGGVP